MALRSGCAGVYARCAPRSVSSIPDVRAGGLPGELLVTTDLVEDRGRTAMTSTVLYPSQKLRDGDVGPTEHGATESYAKLDEYLASIA